MPQLESPATLTSAYQSLWKELLIAQHLQCRLLRQLLSVLQGSTMGSIISEMGWVQLCTRGLPLRIAMVGTLTGLQVRRISCLCSRSAPLGSDAIAEPLQPSQCGFKQHHFALVLPV